MLVAQAQWLPQYADEIPRAKERLAAHERKGTRVKVRETVGAARLRTKTVDEMAASKSETRKTAGQTDRGKMTANAG
jgi:alpha-galactosidase